MPKYIRKFFSGGRMRYIYKEPLKQVGEKRKVTEYKNGKDLLDSTVETTSSKLGEGYTSHETKTIKTRGRLSQLTDTAVNKGKEFVNKKASKVNLYDLNYKTIQTTKLYKQKDGSVITKTSLERRAGKRKLKSFR